MSEATQPGAESIESRIEAAIFGDDAQEPEAVEAQAGEEAEAVSVDAEESEGEAQAEPDDETSEDQDEPEDATDEVELDAESLAGVLGLDADSVVIDDDGNISFKTKIDGDIGTAKLADLVKSYQIEGHLTKKSMALAEERKAFDSKMQEYQQQVAERLAVVDQYTSQAEQQLLAEYQSVNWQQLRNEDPGRYAQLQQDFGLKAQQLQQIKGNAAQFVAQEREKQQAAIAQQAQKMLQQEQELMLADNPSWADPKAMASEVSAMVELGKEHGFSEQEVRSIRDHRMIRLFKLAVAGANATKAAQQISAKKVKKVPKVLRAGKQTTQAEKSEVKAKSLRARVRKGDEAALDELLVNMM